MGQRAVVALDVGGTTVDSACVSATGDVLGEPREIDSPAAGTRDEIVRGLAGAVESARAAAGGFTVAACGIAMPAPFDYAAGVSRMEHKFQAIRGANLGELLRAETGLPAYFVNDADAFGLGVGWRQLPDTKRFAALTIGFGLGVGWRQLPEVKRFAALTIGTGLGGGFIEDGENLVADPRVPPGGEVWDLPFEGGILEDYVSAHGVAALYAKRRPGERRGAREVADLARGGSRPAIEAYQEMGTALGRGLAPVFARFAPEKVVIGGHVGQSLELFGPAMERALIAAGLPEVPILPAAPGNMAIWGAARYVLRRLT